VYVAPRGGNTKEEEEEEPLLAFVAAPLAGGMLFVALLGLIVFLNVAKRKRSQHGSYNPQKQEMVAPRMELDYMLKLPPEERLI